MKKLIIKVIVAIAALMALAAAADGLFNRFAVFRNVFRHDLGIDKTANVITQIKRISELTTACFYEELVIQKDKFRYLDRKVYRNGSSAWAMMANIANPYEPGIVRDSTRTGRIVFIVKTRVRAGYDLSKISPDDLTVSGDTLRVKLPEAEIFDIIANPSDWEVFHSDGNWEDGEIRAIQAEAKETIRKDAVSYGLLDKARTSGKESLISLFRAFGFPEIVLY